MQECVDIVKHCNAEDLFHHFFYLHDPIPAITTFKGVSCSPMGSYYLGALPPGLRARQCLCHVHICPS